MGFSDKTNQRGRNLWTGEEDAILYREAMKQSPTGNVHDWHKVAEKLPGRTNKDCRKRWVNKVCGGLKKGLWDPEEDQRLIAAVEKHGIRWPVVAAEVGSRSPDQCAKRWQYGLDPRLQHGQWTPDEDQLLLELVQERGREWKAIQDSHYPTRSRIDLKNRYGILMRRLGSTAGTESSDMYSDAGSVFGHEEGVSSRRLSSPESTPASFLSHYATTQLWADATSPAGPLDPVSGQIYQSSAYSSVLTTEPLDTAWDDYAGFTASPSYPNYTYQVPSYLSDNTTAGSTSAGVSLDPELFSPMGQVGNGGMGVTISMGGSSSGGVYDDGLMEYLFSPTASRSAGGRIDMGMAMR